MNRSLISFIALYSSKVTWTGVEKIVYLACVMAINKTVRIRDFMLSQADVGEKTMM